MLAGAVDPADCFFTSQCMNPPKVSQRTVRGTASLFDLFSPHSTVLRPESGVAPPERDGNRSSAPKVEKPLPSWPERS